MTKLLKNILFLEKIKDIFRKNIFVGMVYLPFHIAIIIIVIAILPIAGLLGFTIGFLQPIVNYIRDVLTVKTTVSTLLGDEVSSLVSNFINTRKLRLKSLNKVFDGHINNGTVHFNMFGVPYLIEMVWFKGDSDIERIANSTYLSTFGHELGHIFYRKNKKYDKRIRLANEEAFCDVYGVLLSSLVVGDFAYQSENHYEWVYSAFKGMSLNSYLSEGLLRISKAESLKGIELSKEEIQSLVSDFNKFEKFYNEL